LPRLEFWLPFKTLRMARKSSITQSINGSKEIKEIKEIKEKGKGGLLDKVPGLMKTENIGEEAYELPNFDEGAVGSRLRDIQLTHLSI